MRETVTLPYACFACRRSFKRVVPASFFDQSPVLTCPGCGGRAVGLSPKFKPPRRDDLEQWRKVRALVAGGCFFWGGRYPERLSEVPAFLQQQKPHIEDLMTRYPDHFLAITRVAAAAVI